MTLPPTAPYTAEVTVDLKTWHLIGYYENRPDAVAAAAEAAGGMRGELKRHVWYRCRENPVRREFSDPPPPAPAPRRRTGGDKKAGSAVRPVEILGRIDWQVWEAVGHLCSAKRRKRRHASKTENCLWYWDDVVRAAEEDR